MPNDVHQRLVFGERVQKLESGRFIAFYAFFEPFLSGKASRPASLSWYEDRGKPMKETEVRGCFMLTGTPNILNMAVRE